MVWDEKMFSVADTKRCLVLLTPSEGFCFDILSIVHFFYFSTSHFLERIMQVVYYLCAAGGLIYSCTVWVLLIKICMKNNSRLCRLLNLYVSVCSWGLDLHCYSTGTVIIVDYLGY